MCVQGDQSKFEFMVLILAPVQVEQL